MNNFIVKHEDIFNSTDDYLIVQLNTSNKPYDISREAIKRHPELKYIWKEKSKELNYSDNKRLSFVYNVDNKAYSAILGIFSQKLYDYSGIPFIDIELLKKCLEEINEIASGKSVALPWELGYNIRGSLWDEVLTIICTKLSDVKSITFYRRVD